jgi:hypothetical protein
VHHRDRIQEELEDMRQFLKKIGEAQAVGNNIGTGSSTSQTGEEPEASERDTVHTIPQPSATFHITPSMLRMDEIMGKTPLKDLAQLQLVLSHGYHPNLYTNYRLALPKKYSLVHAQTQPNYSRKRINGTHWN